MMCYYLAAVVVVIYQGKFLDFQDAPAVFASGSGHVIHIGAFARLFLFEPTPHRSCVISSYLVSYGSYVAFDLVFPFANLRVVGSSALASELGLAFSVTGLWDSGCALRLERGRGAFEEPCHNCSLGVGGNLVMEGAYCTSLSLVEERSTLIYFLVAIFFPSNAV